MNVNLVIDLIKSLYDKDFFKNDSNNENKSYLFNSDWIEKLKIYLIQQYNIKEEDLKDEKFKEKIKNNFVSKIKNKIPDDLKQKEVINDIKYENKKNKKDNFNYYLKCNIINQKYCHSLYNFYKKKKN